MHLCRVLTERAPRDPFASETQQTQSAKLCRASALRDSNKQLQLWTLIVGLKTMIRAEATLDAVNSRSQDLILYIYAPPTIRGCVYI